LNIFENIKNGKLPDDKVIFSILKEKITDNKNQQEIEKYIDILNNSYTNSSLEEKILLAKVLFVLETLNSQDALYNFLNRVLKFNLHQVNIVYEDFFENFIQEVDADELFDVLNKIVLELEFFSSEELRSFFNWLLHKVWTHKRFFASNRFVDLYDNLKKLLLKLRDSDRIADMMYVEFFTYQVMGNNFQTIDEWREFNENVTKQTIKGYKKFINNLPKPTPLKKDKIKIAFIKDRIVFNSPYKVEYSLFKSLMENKEFRDNYEIIVYTFNQFEKSFDDEKCIQKLEDLGIQVNRSVDFFREDGYYNNHLEKALTLRENIIKDNIDIMIAGGAFPIFNFLYVTRSAPLQIYYSHGNCAYDVPNIDRRVSHFEQVCKEFEWNIINIPIAKEFLVGYEDDKEKGFDIKNNIKKEFGKDVVILGTIGRFVKIDSDEYIKTISEIMRQNPNTIYLACGEGDTEGIKEKLKKYNIDEERFIFMGLVNPHVYGWVIDVWPDSFPLRQGQSKNEYIAKGGVVVFMEEYLNDTIREWYKNSDINVFAKDIKDYIDLISLYINDLEERKIVSEFNKTIFDEKINIQKVLKVFNV